LDRFVEEVEQVRKSIGADASNFYLLGNSWGGLLAMQYSLKYQVNLKGMIIANMMASCPDYGKYAQEVLSKQMDPNVFAEVRGLEAKGDYANPRYMELLKPNFYAAHLCRLPVWPDPVNRTFKHLNSEIYTLMQGPSEFGVSGRIAGWDIPRSWSGPGLTQWTPKPWRSRAKRCSMAVTCIAPTAATCACGTTSKFSWMG
jgi:proline iminopeptidase